MTELKINQDAERDFFTEDEDEGKRVERIKENFSGVVTVTSVSLHSKEVSDPTFKGLNLSFSTEDGRVITKMLLAPTKRMMYKKGGAAKGTSVCTLTFRDYYRAFGLGDFSCAEKSAEKSLAQIATLLKNPEVMVGKKVKVTVGIPEGKYYFAEDGFGCRLVDHKGVLLQREHLQYMDPLTLEYKTQPLVVFSGPTRDAVKVLMNKFGLSPTKIAFYEILTVAPVNEPIQPVSKNDAHSVVDVDF